jgi:hypothetical protein
MNVRLVAILIVLLIVLGGGALLYQRQEAGRRPESAAALGQRLFKDLKAAEVAAIRLVEPQATLTLQRKDQGWVIAERDGFPADLTAVRDFVLKAIELKVGQSEPIGEKDRARLNLDSSGTRVELAGADGKPLAAMVVGKKYFKREVPDPAKGAADGRFVQVAGNAGVVYIVPDALDQASAASAKWIDRTAFKVEKVKSLEVRYPDGGGYRIERARDDADWKLEDLRAGEKLEITKANAASYTLSLLELADVSPKDVKDTGLDKPTRIGATTLAGVSYDIRVGREHGDNYFVAFKSTSEQPREKLLSQYVLLIPKAKLDDTLIRRDELLAKKPDTK